MQDKELKFRTIEQLRLAIDEWVAEVGAISVGDLVPGLGSGAVCTALVLANRKNAILHAAICRLAQGNCYAPAWAKELKRLF